MRFVPLDDAAVVSIVELLMFERAFRDIDESAAAAPEWLETAVAAARSVVR